MVAIPGPSCYQGRTVHAIRFGVFAFLNLQKHLQRAFRVFSQEVDSARSKALDENKVYAFADEEYDKAGKVGGWESDSKIPLQAVSDWYTLHAVIS